MKINKETAIISIFLGIIGLILLIITIPFYNIYTLIIGILFLIPILVVISRKHIDIVLKFLAWLIPLMLLAYVVYYNTVPFGYSETFTIDVGTKGDTDSSNVFYLEESPDLGPRTCVEGKCFRELNGMATVVFDPLENLKGATINISVEGEDVYLIPPKIDFYPLNYDWDFKVDFEKGIPLDWERHTTRENFSIEDFKENYKTNNPNATQRQIMDALDTELGFYDKRCADGSGIYFDGTTRLTVPDTEDKYEEGPMMIYVEYVPEKAEDNQQILGHFNWEIWQNEKNIEFRIGRMNNENGTTHRITTNQEYLIDNKNSLLAIYNPSKDSESEGYLELFSNNNFVGRKYFINETIWKEYNGNMNLGFGWSPHNFNSNPYFKGFICDAGITKNEVYKLGENTQLIFDEETTTNKIKLPIFGNNKLEAINLKILK